MIIKDTWASLKTEVFRGSYRIKAGAASAF